MSVARELSNAGERQLRQACGELDRALRSGRHDRAERYFAVYPLLAAEAHSAVDLIYAEFTAREELGQRPTPEEYYLRFPRWKEALQRQFAIHTWLRGGLEDKLSPSAESLVGEPEEPTLNVPRWLGAYELLEPIGSGGCGQVYRAWQLGLERTVAVKLLPPTAGGLEVRARFCREARVMARLRHPNIMPVYEVDEWRGVVYYSMHFAARGALSGRTAADPSAGADPAAGADAAPSLATVLRWMDAVARAVHHAHQNGVVHCDLKPSNILLDDEDSPLVSDFGLAQERAGEAGSDASSGSGTLIGSPAYMAPEQITARTGAHAPPVDIWALGVLLYELLTGGRPFVSDRLPTLRQLICCQEPAPLREAAPWLPAQLDAICARCLAKDPAQRYPSARALAEDLNKCRA